MTALIVIQPSRGLLLEKSYYRLVGTAVGAVAGMMMLLSSRSPAMLTILLAFWLAACVGAGNLQYGLRSYSAMVAGCTGAVIAMSGYSSPPHLHDLVFGRIACIVIGIVVSTTVTLAARNANCWTACARLPWRTLRGHLATRRNIVGAGRRVKNTLQGNGSPPRGLQHTGSGLPAN